MKKIYMTPSTKVVVLKSENILDISVNDTKGAKNNNGDDNIDGVGLANQRGGSDDTWGDLW